MGIKLTKKDVIWSYIGTIISMGFNLIMLPVLMYYLSEDMLGIWYILMSIGVMATLFDMGFSVTFARNITYCWSGVTRLKKENVEFVSNFKPDFNMIKLLLTTCRFIYGILATIAIILLLIFGTWYITYIGRELNNGVHIISWFIYLLAMFLNLYYGYYISFLRGVGAIDLANKSTVYARALQLLLTILLLYFGVGLIGVCIAYLAYGVVLRVLCRFFFFNYMNIGEKLNSSRNKISKSQIFEMISVVWHNAWRDGVISLTSYLCTQASVVICSLYLSLSQTGAYSIGVQITSAIAQIAGTLYNAYQPELQSLYVNKNLVAVRKVMSIIVTSFAYLFVLGTIVFCLVGIPFLRMVKPNIVVSVPVLIGLAIYQFILQFRNCYTSYFSCTNRINYLNSFVVSSILCVVLSFLMLDVFRLEIWGLIVAQIISQILYNVWWWPRLAHVELKLPFFLMLKMGTIQCHKLLKKCFNWLLG